MAKKVDALVRANSTTEDLQAPGASLPLDGFSRWNTVRLFIPISHEQVRLLEIEGLFPPRVHLSPNVSAWANRELHRWIADPAGYRAPVSDAEPVIGHKRTRAHTAPVAPIDPSSIGDGSNSAARRRFEQLHIADKARKAAVKGTVETEARTPDAS